MNFLFFVFLLGACSLALTNAATIELCCKRCHPNSHWLGGKRPKKAQCLEMCSEMFADLEHACEDFGW
ncbi:unnamed protein product [Cylicocyclus nassatus]|uniref:Uncharacterized protein n=1 Tax=Cylicocyclus nassatus TaxID=53992 RepID=A0AA36GSS5_CYLNA|nr:unnamed protein product [Cylicocyclus nassatus]